MSEHGDNGRSKVERYQQRLSENLQRSESAGDALLSDLAMLGPWRAAGCRHPNAQRHERARCVR